jgi:hypothetical protein
MSDEPQFILGVHALLIGFLLHFEGRERPGFCMIISFPMPEGIGYS